MLLEEFSIRSFLQRPETELLRRHLNLVLAAFRAVGYALLAGVVGPWHRS